VYKVKMKAINPKTNEILDLFTIEIHDFMPQNQAIKEAAEKAKQKKRLLFPYGTIFSATQCSKWMGTTSMYSVIGDCALFHLFGMDFKVKIIDVKKESGDILALVSPEAGSGKSWINMDRLKLIK
jgi:hypothetical protein